MSISISKTKARILTFLHTDATLTMTASVVLGGTEVTVRVMTAEDGAASRRVKVNTTAAAVVGSGRAAIRANCGALHSDQTIDVAAPPVPPATFTLETVGDEVDPD